MTTKVTFTLPASNVIGAAECILLGEFNNWNPEEGIYLQKKEDGTMQAELVLSEGKAYQYRFLFSNGSWVNDDGEKINADLGGFTVENCIIRVPEIMKKEEVEKTRAVKSKAVAKAKPAIVKDDLTRIEGIGKKIESLLNKNNITGYKQLSKATIKSLKEMLDAAGSKFSMYKPDTWPKQARMAAAGKWDELVVLQQNLKAGK